VTIRQAITATGHLLHLFQPQLEAKAQLKLRRLTQRLWTYRVNNSVTGNLCHRLVLFVTGTHSAPSPLFDCLIATRDKQAISPTSNFALSLVDLGEQCRDSWL
jgi:hypothetical protein